MKHKLNPSLPLVIGLIVLTLLMDNRIDYFYWQNVTRHAPMSNGIIYCVAILVLSVFARWIDDRQGLYKGN